MKFNAHRSNKLISKLIRFFSNGNYSHISIEINDHIYEAHIHTGVRKVPVSLWDNSSVVASKEIFISKRRTAKVVEWLEKQVGKKYDYIGIVSFIFILLPPKKGYWFCSELAGVALTKALNKPNLLDNQKISPQLFWDILNLVV